MDMPTLSLGYVEEEQDMVQMYSASDAFVLPSRAETFGLVVLESLACGTPIVSFDVGGLSDMVRPGATGYLAEPEMAEDLAQGITQLLSNDSLRNTMGAQCRSVAENEYSLEGHIQQHEKLHSKILQENRAEYKAG